MSILKPLASMNLLQAPLIVIAPEMCDYDDISVAADLED
jgi:hypothetical protein